MRSLLLLALAACSEGDPHRVMEVQQAVLGGNPSQDPAVVALRSRRLACGGGENEGVFCSGTLIAPRFVLTAAHCVAGRRPGTFEVAFAVSEIAPAGVIAAYPHPAYEQEGAFDLALLELSAPVGLLPVPLASLNYAVSPGEPVRVVGFGLDEGGLAGVQRSGVAKIASVDGPLARYEPAPAMTCGGDSGGPVFLSVGGSEVLWGVTRSGDPACVEFGTAQLVAPVIEGFLAPRLSAAPAEVPAGDFGDFCATPCASDADCPAAMQCLLQRNIGMRCGFPGLQSGRWGDACQEGGSCGEGTCLSVEGPGGGCRCFLPCAPPEALGVRPLELEGGCSLTPSRYGVFPGAGVVGLLLLLRGLRRSGLKAP